MQKIRFLFYGILFGLIFFPIITLGDSFASFLMQGKSIKEATQILIEQANQSKQIDFLIERIEKLEISQEKEESCRKMNETINQANYLYWQGYHRVIMANTIDELISVTQEMIDTESDNEKVVFLENKLSSLQELNEEYLLLKKKCED